MMDRVDKISSSLEDYLEAIYEIMEEKQAVRAKDIALRLGVAASSVTIALRGLVQRGLINHVPYDVITLTKQGRALAENVARKHGILKKFFTNVLAVDDEMADDCACKMEHVVPDEVLQRFVEFVKFEERCRNGGTKWVEGVGFVCNAFQETGVDDGCLGCGAVADDGGGQ
jgi:DtxR family Mn-dependent transcriptional regulator